MSYGTRTGPITSATSIPPATELPPLRTVARVGQLVVEVLRANGPETPLDDFHVEIENVASVVPVASFFEQRLIEQLHKNPDALKVINRRRFEELVAELWDGFGYEVELTKQTRDHGIDVIAIKRREVDVRFLIQCKRPDPQHPVGVGAVRELHSVKTSEHATKGILATTTRFTPDAKSFVERFPWELELKDFEDITEWIAHYLREKGKLGS